MHRIDGPGATVDNKFTEGDPVGGVQATVVTDDWLNDVQEEVMSVLTAAAVSPVKGTQNQLLKSIRSLNSGLIGAASNVKMVVAAASATANLTADEIIVGTALGGQTYRLAGFNKTINLGSPGVGGMDTGAAPVNGYVALYAIYNPTTNISALLATNATAVVAGNVYSGANMPAGFTASALVSVWATEASGKLVIGFQVGRKISTNNNSVLTSSIQQASFTSLSIATAVPPNAKSVSGYVRVSSGSVASCVSQISADATSLGSSRIEGGASVISGNFEVFIVSTQTIWYVATVSAGTITTSIVLTAYTF